ncbi:helix-turn-helix domain-containing protein [Halococcus agarilyticus]|uniref:helix-turn-helix domain-containing protein n=1 Tax=Halococcus agarilyticus TaxID=1232219 RepID=UPI0006777416|nr:helix-turn-helix domain-containing protein [Halococcus agarilyticus]
MIDLTLDVEQYDCPYIAATDDHDVAFSTLNWEFDRTAAKLETRMVVDGGDRATLDRGLGTLREHDQIHEYDLVAKRDGVARIRSTIPTTNAMGTIRDHDGYVTGPFHIESGSERWQVGFDGEGAAEAALAALETDNEFTVEAREEVGLPEMGGYVQSVGAAMTLVDGCRDLSETERETLEAAVDGGYFDRPRSADLGALADEFDVSKPAVSNTLRRGQERVLSRVVDALDDLDDPDDERSESPD